MTDAKLQESLTKEISQHHELVKAVSARLRKLHSKVSDVTIANQSVDRCIETFRYVLMLIQR